MIQMSGLLMVLCPLILSFLRACVVMQGKQKEVRVAVAAPVAVAVAQVAQAPAVAVQPAPVQVVQVVPAQIVPAQVAPAQVAQAPAVAVQPAPVQVVVVVVQVVQVVLNLRLYLGGISRRTTGIMIQIVQILIIRIWCVGILPLMYGGMFVGETLETLFSVHLGTYYQAPIVRRFVIIYYAVCNNLL